MTLPHETEVAAQVARKYRAELNAMTGLHDAIVAMVSAGSWTIPRRGLNTAVIQTIIGLLTKACKTFRAIQILCERGLIQDANVLTRVLMENYVAITFILQKKPKERVMIYHAHSIAQDIKMLNEWRNTPGLKRKVTKGLTKQASDGLAMWTNGLPAGTDFSRHWSGKRNLQEAVKALRGDVMYSTLYRFTSSMAHASDIGAHFELDDVSGDLIWQIEGNLRGFEAPSYAARELLWHAAARINRRLGLEFSALLRPHEVQKQK